MSSYELHKRKITLKTLKIRICLEIWISLAWCSFPLEMQEELSTAVWCARIISSMKEEEPLSTWRGYKGGVGPYYDNMNEERLFQVCFAIKSLTLCDLSGLFEIQSWKHILRSISNSFWQSRRKSQHGGKVFLSGDWAATSAWTWPPSEEKQTL